jgi:hypothetical protein
MVNYVRTADDTWHLATCPDVRRPAIRDQAEGVPDDAARCSTCFADD